MTRVRLEDLQDVTTLAHDAGRGEASPPAGAPAFTTQQLFGEAHEIGIVHGDVTYRLRYRNGVPLYGKTLQTVLAERPCRVIIVGEPGRARAEAGDVSEPVIGAPA